MSGHFLVRSRHGTQFYFRRRVPDDLQALIGKRVLCKSLGTADRRSAMIRARLLASRTDQLFETLRTVRPIDLNRYMGWTLKCDFDGHGRMQRLEVDARPDEADIAIRVTKELSAHLASLPDAADRAPAAEQGGTTAPLTTAPAQASQDGPTIRQVWERYKTEKIQSKRWKDGEDTARYDHWPHVRALTDLIGDRPIRAVTADDIGHFQTHVLADPKGGSDSNRKKRLERAGALFRFAKTKRLITDSYNELFKHPGRVQHASYARFERDDLKGLFESDAYRKNSFTKPSQYWLPPLALFTGARLNELCQLRTIDVGEHDDIPTLTIDDSDSKRLKTGASRRIVPIHSKLIELGFLAYVRSVGAGRIFPELPENPSRPGDFTKEATRWFTTYRRAAGVEKARAGGGSSEASARSRKAFHSFRTTFIDALRRAEVPKDRRTRLAGHEYQDTQDSSYHGGDPMTMYETGTLKNDIEKLKFDVAFTTYQPKLPSARRKRVERPAAQPPEKWARPRIRKS